MNAPTPPLTLTVKPAKISVAVDLADFPLSAVPPAGTPGAKNLVLTFLCDTGPVTLRVSMKVPSLQKLIVQAAAAPQGGFVVLQGRLGPDNNVLEAGAVFQPKPSPAVTLPSAPLDP